jgi:hypothetical protein
LLAGWALLWASASTASAQVADQLVVVSHDAALGYILARYDRKLNLLGVTPVKSEGTLGNLDIMTQMTPDPSGVFWITFGAAYATKLLRLMPDGQLLPSVTLGQNPVGLGMSPDGTAYALTRIGLSLSGPMYAVANDGSVLWSSSLASSLYTTDYADYAVFTSTGQLWLGGNTAGPCGCTFLYPQLTQVDPTTGGVLGLLPIPTSVLGYLAAAPDGTLWTTPGLLTQTDGQTILNQFPVDAGYNGATIQMRIDGAGDIWLVSANTSEGGNGSRILKFSQVDGSLLEEHDMGGGIVGFCLGASGDDAFAVNSKLVSGSLVRRLARANLVTGARSTIPLADWDTALSNGDPSGFILANVVDRAGDNDGDGVANGVETAAHSNPFDPLSRPEGPKVFIDFAPTTNALVLIYQDPDGLLDPVGGLDLSTLSVTIANYGNVFWLLTPFVTALDVSADGKQATLTYGALPLPLDKKWEVEATISDLTGATAWDWQVTPPGDL